MAVSDLVNGGDFGILHRKMKNSSSGVFAFGRNSHGLARVDFHREMLVSTQERAKKSDLGGGRPQAGERQPK